MSDALIPYVSQCSFINSDRHSAFECLFIQVSLRVLYELRIPLMIDLYSRKPTAGEHVRPSSKGLTDARLNTVINVDEDDDENKRNSKRTITRLERVSN